MKAAAAGDVEEMTQDRSSDPATARVLGGVHRLQLSMSRIELLQRPERQQLAAGPKTEQSHRGVKEFSDVKSVDVRGRRVLVGEREVTFEQAANVIRTRVVNRDLTLRHGGNLGEIQTPPPRHPAPDTAPADRRVKLLRTWRGPFARATPAGIDHEGAP